MASAQVASAWARVTPRRVGHHPGMASRPRAACSWRRWKRDPRSRQRAGAFFEIGAETWRAGFSSFLTCDSLLPNCREKDLKTELPLCPPHPCSSPVGTSVFPGVSVMWPHTTPGKLRGGRPGGLETQRPNVTTWDCQKLNPHLRIYFPVLFQTELEGRGRDKHDVRERDID